MDIIACPNDSELKNMISFKLNAKISKTWTILSLWSRKNQAPFSGALDYWSAYRYGWILAVEILRCCIRQLIFAYKIGIWSTDLHHGKGVEFAIFSPHEEAGIVSYDYWNKREISLRYISAKNFAPHKLLLALHFEIIGVKPISPTTPMIGARGRAMSSISFPASLIHVVQWHMRQNVYASSRLLSFQRKVVWKYYKPYNGQWESLVFSPVEEPMAFIGE